MKALSETQRSILLRAASNIDGTAAPHGRGEWAAAWVLMRLKYGTSGSAFGVRTFEISQAGRDACARTQATAATDRPPSGRVSPMAVPCPRCAAPADAPCSSVGPDSYSRGAPLRRAHAERYKAARAAS